MATTEFWMISFVPGSGLEKIDLPTTSAKIRTAKPITQSADTTWIVRAILTAPPTVPSIVRGPLIGTLQSSVVQQQERRNLLAGLTLPALENGCMEIEPDVAASSEGNAPRRRARAKKRPLDGDPDRLWEEIMRLFQRALCPAAIAASLSIGGPALADSFTLRVGSGHPSGPSVYVSDVEKFFVPEVKRRVAAETKHKVEFVEAYGGSLAGVADTLEAVQSGLLDIGAYCFCFEPAKLFLHNFPYYAPFGPRDSVQALRAVRAVYDKVPWLTEQFEKQYGQVLLGLHGWDDYHLGSKDPWKNVKDLNGYKVGGAGPNLPWLEYVGAVPVQSTLPEGYMSLQTGVYSGWLMFPSAYLGFKFYEPAPYYTLIGFGAMPVNGLTISSRMFARLPPDVKKIIVEVGRAYEERAGESLNARQKAGLDGLHAAGAKITELDPQVRADWAKALAELPVRQAKDADKRGMPGTTVMKAYMEAVAATGHAWPYPYKLD